MLFAVFFTLSLFFLTLAIITMLSSFAARSARVVHLRFYHASPLSLEKLNVEGLAQRVNLRGENVLMRVDLNVPLDKVVSVVCGGRGSRPRRRSRAGPAKG